MTTPVAAQGAKRNETYRGFVYIPCSGEYTEGKTIAKTKDGWSINKVQEDDSYAFIVLRSFLDQYLYVREDYVIPQSGNVSTAYWGGITIQDEDFLSAISNIIQNSQSDFEFETGGIFQLNDNQRMKQLSIGYASCPVATNYIGYMGVHKGTWYLTTNISDQDDESETQVVSCYTIPEKHINTLASYATTWLTE